MEAGIKADEIGSYKIRHGSRWGVSLSRAIQIEVEKCNIYQPSFPSIKWSPDLYL